MLCIPAPFQLHPGILSCDPGGSIFGDWFEKSKKIRACSYYFSWNHWKDSYINTYMCTWASLIAQLVKNPPAMQETLVQFLGQEDPLVKG